MVLCLDHARIYNNLYVIFGIRYIPMTLRIDRIQPQLSANHSATRTLPEGKRIFKNNPVQSSPQCNPLSGRHRKYCWPVASHWILPLARFALYARYLTAQCSSSSDA